MTMAASRPLMGGTSRTSNEKNGTPTKASLSVINKKDKVTKTIYFMYNPTEYSLSKSNSWKTIPIVGYEAPSSQFTGSGAVTLTLDLFFDTYESKEDVRNYTEQFVELTKIDQETIDSQTKTGRPPKLLFSWGSVFSFLVVITSLNVTYTLFLSNGTPVRAKMNLSLQECVDPVPPKQNPTSQGTQGHKVYMVKPGDTLDRIAYEEYNDPTVWRHIADTNGLEDPMGLRPGQILAIQPLES